MADTIHNYQKLQLQSTHSLRSRTDIAQAKTANTDDKPAAQRAAQADQVQLTDAARSLMKVSQATQNAPDVDMQKVERLKQALKKGEYQIDPLRVANQMMALENQLSSLSAR